MSIEKDIFLISEILFCSVAVNSMIRACLSISSQNILMDIKLPVDLITWSTKEIHWRKKGGKDFNLKLAFSSDGNTCPLQPLEAD